MLDMQNPVARGARPRARSRFTHFAMLVALLGCSNADVSDGPKAEASPKVVPSSDESDKDLKRFTALGPDRTGIEHQIVWDKPAEYDRIFYSQNAGGGVSLGDYDGDNLTDIYLTSPSGGNRLYRNLGQLRFEDVTEQVGLSDPMFWGTGACFVDIDNDGDLDLYACSYDHPNRLYLNQGNGTFREQPDAFGLAFKGASVMMTFADYDNDGDLDGYLVTAGLPPGPNQQFRVRFEGDRPVVIDELREYWQLLYLPDEHAKQVEAGQFDHLFRNEGKNAKGEWTFVDVSSEAGIDGTDIGQAAVWWDYNRDGYCDLYVANDYWGPDYLYRNNKDGTFTNVVREALPHTPWSSMGVDFGDINQDGLLDLIATDMAGSNHFRQKVGMGDMGSSGWFLEFAEPRQYSRNSVFVNTGSDRFMEAAYMTGLDASDWTWTPRIADLDNDGLEDVLITNGMTREFTNSDLNDQAKRVAQEGTAEFFAFWRQQDYRRDQNLMFRNQGDLNFADVSHEWGFDRVGVSFGAASGDLDGDGDLDIVVNNMDVPAMVYRNNTKNNRSLRLKLVGTTSNRQAWGATVTIRDRQGRRQVRYLSHARGWTSTSEPIVHFGVGTDTSVPEVEVLWPSGLRQLLSNLATQQVHVVTEPQSTETVNGLTRAGVGEAVAAMFARSSEFDSLRVIHRETPFNDYDRQPLLPHKLSQTGPGIACADLNDDGLDDFYIGSAANQIAQIIVSTPHGYRTGTQPAFEDDRIFEDQGAVFFDADNDGDMDLYVVSGSSEWDLNGAQLQDRFYRNQAGRFESDLRALPTIRHSGSVVAAADYDRDGDVDLFVGGRINPGAYPSAPSSMLLRNHGGRFADHSPSLGAARNAGMVTSAVWSDTNNDGWLDLMITYEWGPVRCLQNREGQLVDVTEAAGLANLLGWWNGIQSGDLDHDGDIDFVVTNFGLNTKYHASVEHPVRIYYGDFDGSGSMNIVESEYEDDKLFPIRGKSCSTNAMPFLAERFTTYSQFGLAELPEIYTPEALAKAIKFEANCLESGVLLNDGLGSFRFEPLPRLAQISPNFGCELIDANRDGHWDLFLAQNFYSPQRETGHMDGGISLLLLGNGKGTWVPVRADQSGLVIGADAKATVATDLNGDGNSDVLATVNNGPVVAFLANASLSPNKHSATRQLVIRLQNKPATHHIEGSRVEVTWHGGDTTKVAELSAGSGYLSQRSAAVHMSIPAEVQQVSVRVRWPDGAWSVHDSDLDKKQALTALTIRRHLDVEPQ